MVDGLICDLREWEWRPLTLSGISMHQRRCTPKKAWCSWILAQSNEARRKAAYRLFSLGKWSSGFQGVCRFPRGNLRIGDSSGCRCLIEADIHSLCSIRHQRDVPAALQQGNQPFGPTEAGAGRKDQLADKPASEMMAAMSAVLKFLVLDFKPTLID